MKQLIFPALFFLLFSNACTVQKRIYNKGLAINWHISQGNSNERKQTKLKNPNNQKEIKTENSSVNINTHEDSAIVNEYVRNEITSNTMDSTKCDIIILSNGDELYGRVINIEIDVIKYKKCDNLDGPAYSIARNKVFMIRYSNGTKDIISIIREPSKDDVPSPNTTTDIAKNKADGFFGASSAALALFSVVLLLFEIALPIIIITLMLGFAFGIVGLIDNNNSLAMFGFIFSILTAFLLLFLYGVIG